LQGVVGKRLTYRRPDREAEAQEGQAVSVAVEDEGAALG
jgi:hypothetical protein